MFDRYDKQDQSQPKAFAQRPAQSQSPASFSYHFQKKPNRRTHGQRRQAGTDRRQNLVAVNRCRRNQTIDRRYADRRDRLKTGNTTLDLTKPIKSNYLEAKTPLGRFVDIAV